MGLVKTLIAVPFRPCEAEAIWKLSPHSIPEVFPVALQDKIQLGVVFLELLVVLGYIVVYGTGRATVSALSFPSSVTKLGNMSKFVFVNLTLRLPVSHHVCPFADHCSDQCRHGYVRTGQWWTVFSAPAPIDHCC